MRLSTGLATSEVDCLLHCLFGKPGTMGGSNSFESSKRLNRILIRHCLTMRCYQSLTLVLNSLMPRGLGFFHCRVTGCGGLIHCNAPLPCYSADLKHPMQNLTLAI